MNNYDTERELRALSAPRRNNYFYGKLMDVPHFEMEQTYGNKKRWLLNRLGLGYGVLCGLKLTVRDKKVCVSPGVAIDGYGREIVVPHEVCIDPWTTTDECGEPRSTTLSRTEPHDKVLLCLAYKECRTDFMPVLVTDCNTNQDCFPGTKVEGYCILVQEVEPATDATGEPSSEVPPTVDGELCKMLGSNLSAEDKRKKFCELYPAGSCGVSGGQICVALGTVSLKADGTIDESRLDQCSLRTTLVSNQHLLDMLFCVGGSASSEVTPPPTPDKLTFIQKTSGWTHDEEKALKQFPEALEVTFSGRVKSSASNGRAWFIVTLELPSTLGGGFTMRASAGPGSANSFLTTSLLLEGTVQLKGTKATFTVDESFVKMAQALADPETANTKTMKFLCRVTVKCDFLLDANEKAVDGNHLGGVLPTGDGIPGGDFESWFWTTITVDVPQP